jgi:pilus assembly protein Flp/PilA
LRGNNDKQKVNRRLNMRNLITRFIREEEGASAAEYALLLALIGVVIITAATGLQGAISGAMDKARDAIINAPA